MKTSEILEQKLNKIGHKPSVKLVGSLVGGLGFDPYTKGLPKSGVGYNENDTKKAPFIKWAIDNYYMVLTHHFNLDTKTETETKTEQIETETKPKRKVDFTDLGKIFQDIFDNQDQQINKEEVETIVKDLVAPTVQKAFSELQPEIIIIDKVKEVKFQVEGVVNKKVFDKCIKLSQVPNKNIMIVGPAGSGKTHIAKQIGKALNRDFTSLSVTAGISESALTGWFLPIGEDGRFIFLDAEFLRMYQKGNCVILLDEMDSADPNVLLCINSALSNGGFTVSQRGCDDPAKAHIKRGENVTVISACNTYGNGADHRYVGREQLDLSTLDRFHIVPMDYDVRMEKGLLGANHALIEWATIMRKAISNKRLDRILSTRKIIDYYEMIESGLFTMEDCKEFYFEGWTKDEKAKVQEFY